MDSLDSFRERFEALEQRTEQLHQHTRMVERRLRWWRGIACGLLLVGLVSLPLPSGTAQEEHREREPRGMRQRVQQLEDQVKALQDKLAAFTFDSTNNEVVITGANLRIVNGLGSTDTTNGLGNLIVGYNESRQEIPPCSGSTDPSCMDRRTGSHNVMVGRQHNFSSSGGLVIGVLNEISERFASVSGGSGNRASGFAALVNGGDFNTASGPNSSVSGGNGNTASGLFASVSGGNNNTASGVHASVSGGFSGVASGPSSSVSGGKFNDASGDGAAVSRGFQNTANSIAASVSGGVRNTSGDFSSVSGGDQNTANHAGSVSGGRNNTARGFFSSVSGGFNRTAPGENNWAAGSLFEDN